MSSPPSLRFASRLALLLLAADLPLVHAAGLGRLAGEAVLGEALQVEVALVGTVERSFDDGCVTVSRPPDSIDAEYFPRDLRARVDRQAGAPRLLLTTRLALRQPLLEFRITLGCGVNLSHDYLLMVSPAREKTEATAVRPPPARPAVPAPAPEPAPAERLPDGLTGRELIVERESSLEELGHAHYPGQPQRRERFMRWVVEANPAAFAGAADLRRHRLAPGAKLMIPVGIPPRRPGDRQTEQSPTLDLGGAPAAPRPPVARPTPRAEPPASAAKPTKAPADRLVVGAGGGTARNFKETMAMVERLTGLLEQQVASQAATDAKVQQLETSLAELTKTIAQLETAARQREAQWQAQWQAEREAERKARHEQAEREWWQLLIAIAVGGLLGAGVLHAYRRLLTGRGEPATAAAYEVAAAPAAESAPPAAAQAGDTAPPAAPPAAEAVEPAEPAGPAALAAEPPAAPAPASGLDLPRPPAFDPTPLEFEPPTPKAPAKPSAAAARPRLMHGEPAEAEAALELVDIMTSMGLADSAAQTLVDHIRENPRHSISHWLKLLELHRQAGKRDDFERSAQELREHFNIHVPGWEEVNHVGAARESLENYPHIRSRIVGLWRTPDCAPYLHSLLTDSRQGTRMGFPPPVVEDILLLIAMSSSNS